MRLQKGARSRREALFGGTGAVDVWDLLAGRAAPPFSAVLSCDLEPGGHVGKHRQQRDPEIVIGLEGDGEALVDDVTQPLMPGSVVHLAFGASLEIRNRSQEEPLRYLIIKVASGE